MSEYLKKIVLVAFLFLSALKAFAPTNRTLVIFTPAPEEPFKKLIYAIGMVETKFDTLSYNPVEEAVGYFQIRPIRVLDYNQRTGSRYSLNDMFDYNISEKVFLYYASQIGPYNFEQIAKKWNGSGKITFEYWDQVRKHL
jgi:hypothetical protein